MVFKNYRLGFLLILCSSLYVQAKNGTARGVGSGIMYPAPHLATVVNPAVAGEAPPGTLYGLYRAQEELPYGSLTLGMKTLGLSAAYRQEGTQSNKQDIYEGAVGLRSDFIMVGGTYRSTGGNSDDGDVSIMFDLSNFRAGVVARSISNGANRLDFGVALRTSDNLYLELDIKKDKPYDQKDYLADASFVVDVTNWSLGVGYDTNYSNAKLQKGHVHAGMSLMLSDNLYIDAHYRLQTQEWSADNWNGGLRMIW
ncbi:MAG: hypothetical protein KA116_01510 [Proteobacteria bacterium]|nr:hypothetical protein [Pseudomonadota bacterium]